MPSRAFPVLRTLRWRLAAAFALLLTALPNVVYSQQKTDQPQKPNILVIMGDDIGWFNPSCYNRGMMGYQTPNIDGIAKEGALFSCWQLCTSAAPLTSPEKCFDCLPVIGGSPGCRG